MTIICVRDGIMAADSGTFVGDLRTTQSRKINRAPDGTLGAAAGITADCLRFQAWIAGGFAEGAFNPVEADFAALILTPDGQVFDYQYGTRIPSTFGYAALGGPWPFAQGAMAAGASAERAVELAIEFCNGCAGPVQVERVGSSVDEMIKYARAAGVDVREVG